MGMSRAPGFHRVVRAIFALYPLPFGRAWLNRRLDVFFRGGPPRWWLAPARRGWPKMVLNASTTLQRKLYYFPRYYGNFYGKNDFHRYLTATLKPGSRFLEVGANVGFYTLLAATLVGPQGRVWAFEPEPDICESLARSVRENDFSQVTALPLALSDHEGELTFYRAHDGTASSLVPEAPGHEGRYDRTLTVPVTSLDKVVRDGRLELGRIDVVKVDVEGEEVRTIGGMLETLAAADYPAIWCEVRGPKGSTRAPDTFPAVRDKLAPLGYRPFWWKAGVRRPVADGDVTRRSDVLFERA